MAPAIEGAGVPGEEGAHAAREGPLPGAHQEMGVVREDGSGIDGPRALLRPGGEAGDEVRAIRVVAEEDGPFISPHHDVVEGPRGIETGLAGHGEREASSRCCTWQRFP